MRSSFVSNLNQMKQCHCHPHFWEIRVFPEDGTQNPDFDRIFCQHTGKLIIPIFTARVRSTREGNVLTSVCPSIHPSVCPQGGVPGPPLGVYLDPPRGVTRTPLGTQTPQGVPGPPQGGTWTPLGGCYPDPPLGGTRTPPPGGYLDPPRGYPDPPGGTQTPLGGTLTPPGGVPRPPRGGTQLGQHREYLLHSGQYASCVHAGGLSCQ